MKKTIIILALLVFVVGAVAFAGYRHMSRDENGVFSQNLLDNNLANLTSYFGMHRYFENERRVFIKDLAQNRFIKVHYPNLEYACFAIGNFSSIADAAMRIQMGEGFKIQKLVAYPTWSSDNDVVVLVYRDGTYKVVHYNGAALGEKRFLTTKREHGARCFSDDEVLFLTKVQN